MGDQMVEMLDGDFAFGIWDNRKKRLLLARDRVGVKPLYYAEADGHFVFASEIKALLCHPAISRNIDEEALYHYLTFLVVPAPRTLLQGIYKLPAANWLAVDFNKLRSARESHCYWEPLPGQYAVDNNKLDEQLEELLIRSVEKRLMSDVPVGVLFSGGVDSTINALLFREKIKPEKVRTYHVGIKGTRFYNDEKESALAVAKEIGSEHHSIQISQNDFLETALELASQQDEPLADPVCVPLYFITKHARETGTIVLHAGEGADELFCGYRSYVKWMKFYRYWWRPLSFFPKKVNWLGYQMLRMSHNPTTKKKADALLRLVRGQELFLSSAVAYYDEEKPSILSRDFCLRCTAYDSFDVIAPFYRRIREVWPEASFLQKLTYIELKLRLPELLLMRIDKMSMASGVEARVPFLDRDVVNFALSVPESFKLRDGVAKEPLKRLAAKYVAHDLMYQEKRSFGAPIREWFGESLGGSMSQLITEDADVWDHIFDLGALKNRLTGSIATENEAFQLWAIYNLFNWHRAVVRDERRQVI
jgi:asparagine synthase (glutamine-hydrolysing)